MILVLVILTSIIILFGTGLADCAYCCQPGSPYISADHFILAGT